MPTYTQQPSGAVPTPDPGRTNVPRPMSVETLATGLEVPWGLDFLPDGSAVVTERDSARVLRVDPDGHVTTLGVVEEADPIGEAGLLGVAVSPDFERNREIFVYLTTTSDN